MEAALRRARRERRRVIASVTAPVAAELDLSAAVLAGRRGGDRFFCLEQPDRERSMLAALGEAAVVETTGEDWSCLPTELARRLLRAEPS